MKIVALEISAISKPAASMAAISMACHQLEMSMSLKA
jgi:hypothetical protein